jgi:uncharacterized protein (TIGR03067 family)
MVHGHTALVLGLLFTISSALADDSNGEAKKLDGVWLPVKAELAGKPFPKEVLETMKMVLENGKYEVTVGTQKDQGTTKVDPKAKPRAIDVTGGEGPNQGKTFQAIYELNGDVLKICYDLSGKSRPGKFETKPNTQLFLVTYKRSKL